MGFIFLIAEIVEIKVELYLKEKHLLVRVLQLAEFLTWYRGFHRLDCVSVAIGIYNDHIC